MACTKPNQDFPDEPQIEFIDVKIEGDSATFIIAFTDGDGDLGIGQDEGNGKANIFIYPFEKRDQEGWVQLFVDDTVPVVLLGRIPKVEPDGRDKALEGEIEYVFAPDPNGLPTYYDPFSPDSDTMRYDIQIFDRAGNGSNIITTDEVYPKK